MNVFLFLKGELRQSKGIFFGLTLLLALALAVAVSVIQTERMVKNSSDASAQQPLAQKFRHQLGCSFGLRRQSRQSLACGHNARVRRSGRKKSAS